jgi:phosphoglycolate phosphatase-like HAD superfamily hydrolase
MPAFQGAIFDVDGVLVGRAHVGARGVLERLAANALV